MATQQSLNLGSGSRSTRKTSGTRRKKAAPKKAAPKRAARKAAPKKAAPKTGRKKTVDVRGYKRAQGKLPSRDSAGRFKKGR